MNRPRRFRLVELFRRVATEVRGGARLRLIPWEIDELMRAYLSTFEEVVIDHWRLD